MWKNYSKPLRRRVVGFDSKVPMKFKMSGLKIFKSSNSLSRQIGIQPFRFFNFSFEKERIKFNHVIPGKRKDEFYFLFRGGQKS